MTASEVENPVPTLHLKALGTQVLARGPGAFAALREVQRLESLLTRFLPSPLTQLNAQGYLDHPPAELLAALEHALQVSQESGGLVTPTILPALRAAGYSRSFEQVQPVAVRTPPSQVPSTQGIVLSAQRVTLPAGVQLDLGGTGKSWIIERAADFMSGDFLLDAGGDLVVQMSRAFTLEIDLPFSPVGEQPLYLNLPTGHYGVATSSVLKRAWAGGHHLIDPRTARSSQTRWGQVTAVMPRVTAAEVATKLALLDTPELTAFLEAWPYAHLLAFDRAGQAFVWSEAEWQPHAVFPAPAGPQQHSQEQAL